MFVIVVLTASILAVLVGLLVLVGSAQRRIGWLLVAHGVSFGILLTGSGSATNHAGMVIDQLTAGSWVFLFVWLVVIAYLLPDGHSLSPGWRKWLQAGLVGVAMFLVGAAGDSGGFRADHHGSDPPLTWLPAPIAGVLGVAGLMLTVGLFFGAGLAVRARLRRASGPTRLQLLWLVWGATSLPLALVLVWVAHFALHDNAPVIDLALALAGTVLPVTVGIAILRYQLFDIQMVLSRTVTYGVLLSAVVAAYTVLLVVAQGAFGKGSLGGAVAVALVAVLVSPAYARLRRRVERWVYGYRSDPALALRKLGADLESADPLQLIEAITASVRDALRVGAVWMVTPGAQPAPDLETVRVPLVYRDEPIADLVVVAPAGRRLSPADVALLHDLARHAAVTVRAAQLAGELQTSRSRIVTAREEERKRLRRELHDGIGPSLAAILLKVETARTRQDADSRDLLLTEIRDETKATIVEVRRVVDGLRPPAIDEVGLTGAIRQRAASLSTDRLVFEVSCPSSAPPVPAAVEVAALRIASEAMTNVIKHAGASRCRVELTVDGTLELTISDNGRGLEHPRPDRVGWASMAERAAELGGSCTISERAEGGVVVHAVLPLHDETATEAAIDSATAAATATSTGAMT
ncbi:hypothetical protein JCM18899A_05120 [Nocardioides sp. AN3]